MTKLDSTEPNSSSEHVQTNGNVHIAWNGVRELCDLVRFVCSQSIWSTGGSMWRDAGLCAWLINVWCNWVDYFMTVQFSSCDVNEAWSCVSNIQSDRMDMVGTPMFNQIAKSTSWLSPAKLCGAAIPGGLKGEVITVYFSILLINVLLYCSNYAAWEKQKQIYLTSLCWALNMTLSAFAAERRRLQHGARSAPAHSYRSIFPTHRMLSSKTAGHRCCCQSMGQTDDGWTDARPLHRSRSA